MADFYKVRTATGWGIMGRAGDEWIAYISDYAEASDESYINSFLSDYELIEEGDNSTFQGLPLTVRK